MIEIQIPKDKSEIKRQIEALEWQINYDKSEKDREIHVRTLECLKKALND
ncbi:hypothetical protein DES36_1329 [Alkalibaculum bacchi]|uniref:Uncharacterized protein n=1 Tax=Alkalibaculum bacchi TaxID=645887 RepID=A0A366HWX1_9FIRM|nr:hypothetical protein [Alkalibaculum bacchi]RBP57166.1 hypothetical protein DES36_1329 [Alkalibaculum bacchi]